jgi:hypothetical protein
MESFAIWFLLIIGFWAGYATRHVVQRKIDKLPHFVGNDEFTQGVVKRMISIRDARKFVGEDTDIVNTCKYRVGSIGVFEITIKEACDMETEK